MPQHRLFRAQVDGYELWWLVFFLALTFGLHGLVIHSAFHRCLSVSDHRSLRKHLQQSSYSKLEESEEPVAALPSFPHRFRGS